MRADRQEEGAAVVIVVLAMVALVGMAAFALDVGLMYSERAKLQTAADAAALAAVTMLPDQGEAASEAQIFATANYPDSGTILAPSDISFGYWDDAGRSFTNGGYPRNAVRVTTRRADANGNPVDLNFSGVFGRDTADVKAAAVAIAGESRCGLFIGLDSVVLSGSSYTDSYDSDDGPYDPLSARDDGHVCSNGDIVMSGSTQVRGNALHGPDAELKTSGTATVTGTVSPLVQELAFPPVDPGDAAWNNDNDSIPLSDDGKQPLKDGKYKLSGSDGADLPAGTYYFAEMSLSGSSSVRITGPVVIYITNKCDLSGGTLLNTSQLPANLQLQVIGDKCVLSGSSDLYAVVYAPVAKVDRSGSTDFYGSIIADELIMSGSGGIHGDESLDDLLPGGGVVARLVG